MGMSDGAASAPWMEDIMSSLPRSNLTRVPVRFPRMLYEALRAECTRRSIPMSVLVCCLVREWTESQQAAQA